MVIIPKAKASHPGYFYDWQYNGAAPFKEILAWCEQSIPDEYGYNGFETIFFNNQTAYTHFLLRWS